jgi:L-aminopeptidase/D-esterase-like protein
VADYAKALFDGALPGGPVSGDAVSGGAVSSGAGPLEGSGTLTVVVTNVRLSDRELARFGRQVHASLARAIQPFHTDADADVLFAVTTDEINGPRAADGRPSGTSLSTALASVAAEAAWDAVLRSTV